jgi:cytoskeleton protein RodZ
MSEPSAANSNFAASPGQAPDAVTAGTLLRRAREAAGLHIAALAVSLKVPVRKLEALENDRYDLLTDAVFVRALASSVCRTLKIDSRPVLDRLPHTEAPRLVRYSEGLNAPFRAPRDGAAPGWLEQLSKPVFLAVFALLLGALVLILLPTVQQEDRAGEPATNATAGPAAEGAAVTATESAATPALAGPTSSPLATSGVMTASLATPATGPGPAGSPSAPAAAPPPAEASGALAPLAEAPAAAVPASGIVLFRAKSPSWVEVTDAKGMVAVRKILAAGEAAAASGAVPLQVTVGRVDVTEVQVRGKPFDLRPVTKDNVARFQVK